LPPGTCPGGHHAQKPSSVSGVSAQSPVVRDNRDQIPTPVPKNDPVLDHLAQHHRSSPVVCTTHASEHIATVAGGPIPLRTDHIRSDLRPRRAQRRTRT
jgi:hypothetical protein